MNTTHFLSEQELQDVSNPELAMIWNGLVDTAQDAGLDSSNKAVSRFPTKSAGIARIQKFQKELQAHMNGEAPPEQKQEQEAADDTAEETSDSPETTAKRSAATAKTWLDPVIAASRKHRVRVRANGVVYGSVPEACRDLNLPMGSHIKFRGQLRADGTGTYNGVEFQVITDAEYQEHVSAQKESAE